MTDRTADSKQARACLPASGLLVNLGGVSGVAF